MLWSGLPPQGCQLYHTEVSPIMEHTQDRRSSGGREARAQEGAVFSWDQTSQGLIILLALHLAFPGGSPKDTIALHKAPPLVKKKKKKVSGYLHVHACTVCLLRLCFLRGPHHLPTQEPGRCTRVTLTHTN